MQTLTFPGDRHVEDHPQPQRLDETDGGDGKEDAAQAQHRQTNDDPDQPSQQGSHQHVERQGSRQVQAHDHGGIGANRHEGGVGQRQLARVERDKQGDRQDGVDADLGDQQLVLVVEADGIREELDDEIHGRS